MGRTPVDDTRPPPWEPTEILDSTVSIIDVCRRLRADQPAMMFDANGRPCRTIADLERTIQDGTFPVFVYPKQPRGKV